MHWHILLQIAFVIGTLLKSKMELIQGNDNFSNA